LAAAGYSDANGADSQRIRQSCESVEKCEERMPTTGGPRLTALALLGGGDHDLDFRCPKIDPDTRAGDGLVAETFSARFDSAQQLARHKNPPQAPIRAIEISSHILAPGAEHVVTLETRG
jgi:hypothetical protein